MLLLAAGAYAVPGLERARLFAGPNPVASASATPMLASALVVGESEITEETGSRPELDQPEHVELPRASRGPIAEAERDGELPQVDAKAAPVPLIDPSGRALDGFYAALMRTRSGAADGVTRVVHFGDSIVVSDLVSGTLRRKLQTQFGDAGHGFVLFASPWPAYHHNDVRRWASRGWVVSRIVGPLAADGLYGLGGVSFKAPTGARARVGTATTGHFGRSVSRFVVDYLEQPGGGRLLLNLDGRRVKEVDTRAAKKGSASVAVETDDGEHELELVIAGTGQVRIFGVVLERQRPGVVLDALGVQGARIRFLDKQDDAHWAEQLRWRDPDLMIFQFGANESADGFAYPMDEYLQTMKDVLLQARHALPEAGCLVMGAMDRARKLDDSLRTLPIIPLIVERQRTAAREVGCAFFDTYRAMGGRGSMAKWVRRGLGAADLTHPTSVGAEILGNWLYRALMQGFGEYAARAPRPASAQSRSSLL
ncbi:MAG: hypothetical protein JW940_34140 [Polyangiaceae bacterium]|nr:hypothetical protein [Polyangiaceae bacterium]